MDKLYQSALNGTLASQSGSPVTISFKNDLPCFIRLAWADPSGRLVHKKVIKPAQTAECKGSQIGFAYVFTVENTGAFIAAYRQEEGDTLVAVTTSMLCDPLDIGTMPTPTSERPIPGDSPPVAVGMALTHDEENVEMAVTRHQYWRLSPESHVLLPTEKRVVSFQETAGVQQTTSEQETVSKSIGLSASAGWGAVSASLSSSLSQTSTSMQQVMISTETVRYESVTLQNKTDKPQMFLNWQATDVITVLRARHKPVASIVSTIRPIIVRGPYDPNSLPDAEYPSLPDTPPPEITVTD